MTTTADARRLELTQAVLDILSTEGWDGLTVRRIAARSDVSPGAMPHFVGTKQDMVTAAVRHQFAVERVRLLGQIADASSPEARLRTWVATVFAPDAPETDRWGFWFCIWGRIPFDQRVRSDLVPLYREVAAAVTEIVEDGISEGSFRGDLDARSVGDEFVALIPGLAIRCALDPAFPPERVQELGSHFVDQLLVPPAPRSGDAE